MNCYGDKPDWFWKLNRSGGIPVASVDGRIITESNEIITALEDTFVGGPYRALLPVAGSANQVTYTPIYIYIYRYI